MGEVRRSTRGQLLPTGSARSSRAIGWWRANRLRILLPLAVLVGASLVLVIRHYVREYPLLLNIPPNRGSRMRELLLANGMSPSLAQQSVERNHFVRLDTPEATISYHAFTGQFESFFLGQSFYQDQPYRQDQPHAIRSDSEAKQVMLDYLKSVGVPTQHVFFWRFNLVESRDSYQYTNNYPRRVFSGSFTELNPDPRFRLNTARMGHVLVDAQTGKVLKARATPMPPPGPWEPLLSEDKVKDICMRLWHSERVAIEKKRIRVKAMYMNPTEPRDAISRFSRLVPVFIVHGVSYEQEMWCSARIDARTGQAQTYSCSRTNQIHVPHGA